MNNKGFTLIEVLSVIVLTSIIIITVFTTFKTTFGASKEEAYKVMKNNIVSVGYDYINECNLGTINCDFSYQDNNKFKAIDLQNAGFFKDLESPIDGKYLGTCLELEATINNGVTVINLIDNCYSDSEESIFVDNMDDSIEQENSSNKSNNKDKNKDKNKNKNKDKNKDKKQKKDNNSNNKS